MCQQAREEEAERRNERKEGREESRGGIQIEKKKKNPLLCLSPSYQPSLTRGGRGGRAEQRRVVAIKHTGGAGLQMATGEK